MLNLPRLELNCFCLKKYQVFVYKIPITSYIYVPGTCSVILHDVLVPAVIQNGTVPFVVLDCHYSMNHSEKDGMILKWYLNGRTVYQWIPPTHPQVSYF